MSGLAILIGDHQGVYIPQQFAENFISGWLTGSQWDIEVLEKGPEHESYWDVWDWVLSNAKHIDKKGNTWHLYQDGDLWAYCEELMTEEEKNNFFGE